MAAPYVLPWPFPWPGKKDKPEVNPDLDPVLLIPGIGGSILDAVFDNGKRERIWVRLLNADHEFRKKLWSKFDPETGKTCSLDPDSHIEVPQDNSGLFAVDTLDPDLKIPLDMVNYYRNMIVEMRKWGYGDGENLFGFGFDFRQSNRLSETMEALRTKLKEIHEQTGKKVTIITHSMGGLLLKSFLALHHEEVAAHVKTWLAIAAPFRGAPGFIMDTLLTGVEFLKGWQKDLFIAKWSMHQLLVECPSVYELMTEYEFEWEETPELRIVRPAEGSNAGDGNVIVDTIASHHKVIQVLEEALKDNTITINKTTVPIPLSKPIVSWARETRDLWKKAKIPDGVKFYNIYGIGLETPLHCKYGSEKKPIVELKEILHSEADFENVDGDGTVPVESAKADGFDAIYRVGVPGEHRALLRDPRVFRLVKYFLDVPELDPLYDPLTDFVVVPSTEQVEEAIEQAVEEAMGAGGVGLRTIDVEAEFGFEIVVRDTQEEEMVVVAGAGVQQGLDREVNEEEAVLVQLPGGRQQLAGQSISRTVSEVHIAAMMQAQRTCRGVGAGEEEYKGEEGPLLVEAKRNEGASISGVAKEVENLIEVMEEACDVRTRTSVGAAVSSAMEGAIMAESRAQRIGSGVVMAAA